MPILNYRRNPPDQTRQGRLTRTEFVIVLAGAAVLVAILLTLYRLLLPPLEPF
jgi:hypothetical protein